MARAPQSASADAEDKNDDKAPEAQAQHDDPTPTQAELDEQRLNLAKSQTYLTRDSKPA